MPGAQPVDRPAVHAEMARVRVVFRALVDAASPADLARPTRGTRWTNEQMLYHLLFGYLVVRALRLLVKLVARLPDGVGRGFAGLLDSAAAPFHVVNYWGSRLGPHVAGPRRMASWMDRVTASLERHLDRESDAALLRSMPFPQRWDPFFRESMSLGDVYRYPTQHFDFHRQQLTLE